MASRSTSKSFPGFEHTYWVRDGSSSREYRGRFGLAGDDAFAVTRAEEKVLDAVEVRWAMGAKMPSDIVWTTSAAPLVVSERVIEVLNQGGFSGWSTYPVSLFDAKDVAVPGYQGLSIHGRCGKLLLEKSKRIDKTFPGGVFPVWKGMYFDESTWDGSDLFVPAYKGGWIFAVRAVKEALESAKVKGLAYQSLEEYERAWQ